MNLHRIFAFRELDDEPKPFLDHIEDLRTMLIKMVIVLGLAMTGSFFFRGALTHFLQAPLAAVDIHSAENLQSLGVADSMMISFQLAFYAGLTVSLPFLLFFLTEFILPALTPREREALLPTAVAGFALFLGGVAFAYLVVLPQTLAFFYADARSLGWSPTWTVREYYSFATQFLISFGLAFELPVAVLLLVRIGILDSAKLSKFRAHAVVIILFLAAVITPTTDVITLMLMGGPMYVLYELCVVVARFVERRPESQA